MGTKQSISRTGMVIAAGVKVCRVSQYSIECYGSMDVAMLTAEMAKRGWKVTHARATDDMGLGMGCGIRFAVEKM